MTETILVRDLKLANKALQEQTRLVSLLRKSIATLNLRLDAALKEIEMLKAKNKSFKKPTDDIPQ